MKANGGQKTRAYEMLGQDVPMGDHKVKQKRISFKLIFGNLIIFDYSSTLLTLFFAADLIEICVANRKSQFAANVDQGRFRV